jgi:putative FmdB family regulatory protein
MPTYDFDCPKCDKPFDVVQSIKAYDGSAECPTCKNVSRERIFSANVTFIGASVEHAEFNHGLGIVTKNSRHRRDEARARGLEEVGTEKVEKIHTKFENDRAEKRKRSWDEV